MAICDLLYACLECGRVAAIKTRDQDEACEHCGTRYQRVEGARIRVQRPDGTSEVKHPAEWLDLLELTWPIESGRPDLRERVLFRQARTDKPLWHRGIYLGRIEEFGPTQPGWLTLTRDELRFQPDQGESQVWLLNDLTAVQPSSTSLQLKVRRGAVLSLRFPQASPLLWEERVRQAVQALYTQAGRGEIREFQPRIVCP